jgi:hypothetical protein
MVRQFAYSTVSAGTAALLLLLMIAAGRVLGDVEFGSSRSRCSSAACSKR